jgi:hypothetical protein
MKNMRELRDALVVLYSDIKTDAISLEKAKELNNSAGKIINTVKTEISYQELLGTKKEIGFLE